MEVLRDSLGDLHWRTKADRINALLEDELKEFATVPPVVFVPEKQAPAPAEAEPEAACAVVAAADAPCEVLREAPRTDGGPEPSSEAPAPRPVRRRRTSVETAVALLVKIGCGKEEAREEVSHALDLLGDLGRPPSVDEIFNTAVSGRRTVLGPCASKPGSSDSAVAEKCGGDEAALEVTVADCCEGCGGAGRDEPAGEA